MRLELELGLGLGVGGIAVEGRGASPNAPGNAIRSYRPCEEILIEATSKVSVGNPAQGYARLCVKYAPAVADPRSEQGRDEGAGAVDVDVGVGVGVG